MHYIDSIKNTLKAGLPGKAAHDEMMSSLRQSQLRQVTHNQAPLDAAVLILLYKKEGEWHIPFIRRTVDNHAHSGQISLPGGRYETTDTNLRYTALRETEEEIGVSVNEVETLGNLTSLYIGPSNFNVTPFAGIYTGNDINFVPDKNEVDHIIEVPVKRLMNPESIISHEFNVGEINFSTPCFDIDGDIIWGATAMIINEFLSLTKKEIK